MAKSLGELSDGLEEAVEKAAGFTVMVEGRRRRPASGVVFDKEVVLTANHAVERDEEIRITLPGGAVTAARLVGRDPARDLAVLRTSESGGAPVVAADRDARVGQLVLCVARTAFDGINATFGIVSASGANLSLWRGGVIERYLQADAPRYPGFSGGPLVDAGGRLLGVNVFGQKFGTSIAIPAGLAFDITRQVLAHGSIQRGYVGIRSQPVDLQEHVRAALSDRQRTGLLIVGVEEGSPADKAGILTGDILVGFNGKTVETHEQLLSLLGSETPGREVPAEVLRGGTLTTVPIPVRAAR